MNKADLNKIERMRHSLSHILATAVKEKFPRAKLGIGPAINNGFYYDFELKGLSEEHLSDLENHMKEMIGKGLKFEKEETTPAKAKKIFADEPYKIELIDELKKEKKPIIIYKTFIKGDKKAVFTDLCSGPHIKSPSEINIDSFKLTKVAGAYWRGDEKNNMLVRVYGIAFANNDELKNYLTLLEEAEKRDHRKLGKELDLFCFSDLVGPGLPLFTPNGTIIKDELQKHVEQICRAYGFQKVSTPHLAKIDLYEISGHAAKFGDELFHVTSKHKQNYVMKPVQCPHQTQIFACRPRSYKDLPIRYMESEKQYRAEKPGEIGGLQRVIAITVEDGHSFCRIDQVKQEVIGMVNIIKEFYSSLGLWGNHWVSLSVRDKSNPEKYIGDPKDWNKCEKMLKEVSDELGLNAKRCEGEAALYGPKLDFMFKDALGKEIQIPTVQLDFATPKRFNLVYTNEKGKPENPVMVHRAILGSYERFMMLLIEHFAGAFPIWLSPVQATIIPISDKQAEYAGALANELVDENIRFTIADSNDTLGKRIRAAEMAKIPYLLIVGEKEALSKTVSVRKRGQGDLGVQSIKNFLDEIKKDIKEHKNQ